MTENQEPITYRDRVVGMQSD